MPLSLDHVVLPGTLHRQIEAARHVGRPEDHEEIEVTLLLRYPPAGGPAHIDEQGGYHPHDRTHLSHDEFAGRHGASPDDMALVAAFAARHKLTLVEGDAAQRLVTLRMRVDVANRIFNVDLSHYEHHDGAFRGHDGHVHVPAELQYIVVGVFGLNTAPMARRRRLADADEIALPRPETTPHFTAPQLASIYNFPADADGSGECIALLQFEAGYIESDLQAYFEEVGVPMPAIEAVSVAGATNSPDGTMFLPDGRPSLDAEVMLDIEVAGAAAPGATLAVYFAPNSQAGWVRAVKQAVHDKERRPSVISISWSKLETVWDGQTRAAVNDAFRDAAALGITVCVSSGDFGSADKQPEGAHVNFPGSSPYVLACGGTRLTADDGRVKEEVVWNELNNHLGATGGGVSIVFEPPHWQARAHVPPHCDDGETLGRGLPDVAANADPRTGYLVRVDGERFVTGGTSASTPLWAALVARINQSLGQRVGFLNELIYMKAPAGDAFRHITEGNNGAYHAGEGWNACTGWGSPDGARLLELLKERS